MTFREEKMDLFTVDESYFLAHCIASDLALGAGVAVPMNKKFGLREKIRQSGQDTKHPTCILTGRVFNLITKPVSYGKPTLKSLVNALWKMKEIARAEGITKIAMPRIGCGLDRLSWAEVRSSLQEIFENTDIEILVCVWK